MTYNEKQLEEARCLLEHDFDVAAWRGIGSISSFGEGYRYTNTALNREFEAAGFVPVYFDKLWLMAKNDERTKGKINQWEKKQE